MATIESEVRTKRAQQRATQDHSTKELKEILKALQAVRDGDFGVQLPGDWTGLTGKLADTINEIVFQNRRLAEELSRVGQQVGREGRTRERIPPAAQRGTWQAMDRSVNQLIDDLLWPTDSLTRAAGSITSCRSRVKVDRQE